MDENSGSDKSIIDFDDEYSEKENQEEKINKKTISDENEKRIQSKNKYRTEEEENQAIVAPEDEEQIEISSEGNIIYDPKIKELNEIDVNNKQAIIDILMQDNLITKKRDKNEESIKEKNKNKFAYIESKMNKNIGEDLPKKNSYGRVGYQIEPEEGDPQFVKDINVAAYLLKPQIQEENQDIAKLLFDDVIHNPITKKIVTNKQIGEKVKKTLEKRKKNLEKIEAKMYEEQKSQETLLIIEKKMEIEGI